jgi:hypothetical protein
MWANGFGKIYVTPAKAGVQTGIRNAEAKERARRRYIGRRAIWLPK